MKQGCIFSSYLINLYAKYILRETGFEEGDHGGRSINNLNYANNIAPITENVKELQGLIIKVMEHREKWD